MKETNQENPTVPVLGPSKPPKERKDPVKVKAKLQEALADMIEIMEDGAKLLVENGRNDLASFNMTQVESLKKLAVIFK